MRPSSGSRRPSLPSPTCCKRSACSAIPTYLLRVRTTDLAAYAELEDDTLSAIPGVQRLNSTLVMKQVVADRAIPT